MIHILRIVSSLLLLSIAYPAVAHTFRVKGLACDSTGSPESFATVRIYLLPDTVRPDASAITDDEGRFDIALAKPGRYRANVFSTGKTEVNRDFNVSTQTPTADLGKIIMADKETELAELTVTARRPLVTKEIDRIGYDVQADDEAKTSQLDEILRKVPLVSVDPDGTIKVKGSTDFKIYKNGRPNNSFTRNAKDIFKALPASMIKRIEVITDPGAREDAEGSSAILNIVTLNNTVIKGVMGSVGIEFRTNEPAPSPSLWIQTQIDKLNISGYGGYNHSGRSQNKSRSESLSVYEDSGNRLQSESEGNGQGDLGYFGIEASLEPDTLNLFTAEFGGYIYNHDSREWGTTVMTAADGAPVYSYSTVYTGRPNRYLDLDGRLNYQRSTRRKGETLTLSYLISSTNQRQHNTTEYADEVNLPVPYRGTSNDFTLDFLENTLQFDWTRPITDSHKLDVGAKYINRNNHSINYQDYIDYEQTHTDFTHLTQVFAVYGDYRLRYGIFGARAGLRYEYSRLSARFRDGSSDPFHRDLSDWVPNVSFSCDLPKGNTLKLSYSTRINRPGISQLNPARVETPSSVSEGNPDLESTLHQSAGLNLNHIGSRFSFDLNTSFGFSDNAVISVRRLLPGDITYSTYANSGKERIWNTSVWLNYSPTPKTSVMVNANAAYNRSSNPGVDIKADGWSSNIFMRVRQTLPWEIAVTGFYSFYQPAPGLYHVMRDKAFDRMFYGVNIQRSFLKERRLSVTLAIMNPFARNTSCSESTPVNTGYSGYTRSYSFNRANNFGINISYRFGSLNAQVKKTAASINNDDLGNRKN